MNNGPTIGPPLFVDASGWIAAFNRRDRHHPDARGVIDACLVDRLRMATTNWTIYEALSTLKSRVGWQPASDLWELVSRPRAVTFVQVTEAIEARALDLFLRYRDKTWGVVDCASLVVMEELGCRQALAFDRHFVEASRQRGFVLLPER